MIAILLLVGGVLLLLAGALWQLAARARRASGLPPGQIIYEDTASWQETRQPLRSRRYRLSGKPDYLTRQGEEIIPVEVKSSRLPANGRPYHGHKLQLLSYCLLIEEVYGKPPSYGIIHYTGTPGGNVLVPFDADAREELLSVMAEIRAAAHLPEVHRQHQNPHRCRQCSLRSRCDEALS